MASQKQPKTNNKQHESWNTNERWHIRLTQNKKLSNLHLVKVWIFRIVVPVDAAQDMWKSVGLRGGTNFIEQKVVLV